jgi:hypothetical protein
MAKNARISDTLYALAQAEAWLQDRSIAQQIEHWAKLGMAAARRGDSAVGVVESAAEVTRRMDILEVQAGRRLASDLHFIPADRARESKVMFSGKYSKS